MVESSPTRVRMGKAEVIPLTELVNTSLKNLQQLFELKDPDLRYILIDAESYVDDSFITDPIRRIIGYALMVNNLGKKVVVFNIYIILIRNIKNMTFKFFSIFSHNPLFSVFNSTGYI